MATHAVSTGHAPPHDNAPHSQHASTANASATSPPPSLIRRSSFEPMRLGLSSLPPPVFSRAPPGQRSVPAIEFLNKDSIVAGAGLSSMGSTATVNGGGSNSVTSHSLSNNNGGLPSVLGSGTNTPGAGLGNGSMTSEPWNLWSDSTAPLNNINNTTTNVTEGSATTAGALLIQEVVQANLNASTNSREDNELASALAAAVVLDKNHDKRSSITSRNSSSSRSISGARTAAEEGDNSVTAAISVNVSVRVQATSWSEELATDGAKLLLLLQNFALDPHANPERRAGGDLGIGKITSSTAIPRNVSFSSMLDLPQPEHAAAASVRDSPPSGTSPGSGTGLDRKGSLTRRVTSNTQSPLSTLSSSSSNTLPPPPAVPATVGNESLSLPSLAFSASSSPSNTSPGAASTYTNVSPATSFGSALRQGATGTGGNILPSQSKTTTNYGLGIDEYGIRSRQGTNTSSSGNISDYSSTTSITFGTTTASGATNGGNNGNNRGIGGFNGNDGLYNNDQGNFGAPEATGMGGFNPRRDSGYGPSIYNSSHSAGIGSGGGAYGGDDRRGSRSASWQINNQYGGGLPMNRGNMPSYSYSPPPPPNPHISPFSLTPMDGGSSFMSLNSNSSGGGTNTNNTNNSSSSSSSLLRYPSLNGVGGIGNGNLDYLIGSPTTMQNYGFGLGGFGSLPPPSLTQQPSSPFMRFPNSLPSMGLGGGNGGAGGYMMNNNNEYDRPRLFEGEKNRPIRSPLLEEFRADKLKRWGVRDMHGHIAEFMCDQVGSRYIQESILEHPTSQDCDLIFNEIHHLILQLSIDVFANFCVQKLLEKASTEQISIMAENLKGNVLRLSLQTYGCRVIQKTLEVVSPEHQVMILRELDSAVQKCVRDQNANHVIQKIVTTCPPDLLQFVVDAFIGNVYTFATHPYSCRVLQRILENCPERMTRPILEELKSYALNLMQDQYGNYVIQFCLERGLPHDKSDIICQIHGQVLHFSKHKFASNVIEKCIINANEHELNMIAAEVLAPGLDGNTGIQAMLRHEYANYPLQRLIKHTSGPVHMAIVEQVGMQLAMFRDANPPFNAKHLVAVEKLLVDLSPNDFPGLMRRRFEDHYISRAR